MAWWHDTRIWWPNPIEFQNGTTFACVNCGRKMKFESNSHTHSRKNRHFYIHISLHCLSPLSIVSAHDGQRSRWPLHNNLYYDSWMWTTIGRICHSAHMSTITLGPNPHEKFAIENISPLCVRMIGIDETRIYFILSITTTNNKNVQMNRTLHTKYVPFWLKRWRPKSPPACQLDAWRLHKYS